MNVLPYAIREIFEFLIWTSLTFYVLGRSGTIDFEIVNTLTESDALTELQMLVNSPNCLAYEKRLPSYTSTVQTIIENSRVYPNTVDIIKFYDPNHQNCLKFNTYTGQELGHFKVYDVALQDLESGRTYSYRSDDIIHKVNYKPSAVYPELEEWKETGFMQSVGWANELYPYYGLHCDSMMIKQKYRLRKAVKIVYPTETPGIVEESPGILTLELCIGDLE